MHTGVGFYATSVSMGADEGTSARAGAREGGMLALDMSDPGPMALPPVDDPRLKDLEEMMAARPPLVAPPPLQPPERESKLVLGIDKSDQISPNWLGVADPTEHMARLSEVTQPQLDPNPGSPGAAGAGAVRPPMADPRVAAEARPSGAPAKANDQPLQEPVMAREGDPNGRGENQETRAPRDGDPLATGDKATEPPGGTPEPNTNDLPLPGTPERLKGVESKEIGPAEIADKHEAIRAIESRKAVKPVEAVPNPSAKSAIVAREGAAATAPPPVAGSDAPGENAGGGGDHPGTKSEKEADASSTTPTLVIRPGQPAAAEGLDIVTRRPNFTRLTRVVAYPEKNPLFKVTFNHKGVVTRVRLVESSGIRDVDEPVINAIYQWTAKGKALAELASEDPAGGLTISVRILLR